jgi:hypothetical protein
MEDVMGMVSVNLRSDNKNSGEFSTHKIVATDMVAYIGTS